MTTQHYNDEIEPQPFDGSDRRQRRSGESSPNPATWITMRDIEILRSIGRARVLTTPAIEWLHWRDGKADKDGTAAAGGYRARLLAASKAETAQPPRVMPAVHRRLAGLVEHGYLVRLIRSGAKAPGQYARLPDAFGLSAAGRDYLREIDQDLGHTPEYPYLILAQGRSMQTIEHAAIIGETYAALRAMLEHRGQTLADWQCDTLLARDYDTIDCTHIVYSSGATGGRETSIIPDATFVVGGVRYFVEAERGTNNGLDLDRKLLAYQQYRGSKQLQARYGVNNFVAMIIGRSPRHTRSLMQRVAEVVGLDAYRREQSGHQLATSQSKPGAAEAYRDWHTKRTAKTDDDWYIGDPRWYDGWRFAQLDPLAWHNSAILPITIRRAWYAIAASSHKDTTQKIKGRDVTTRTCRIDIGLAPPLIE